MTRDEAREYILEHATECFERDRSGKGYICPICGSGSGEHGTGMTENPKEKGHFTCWTGCFKKGDKLSADIFEVIGLQYHLSDFAAQFEKACEIFGVKPERYGEGVNMAGRKEKTNKPETQAEDFTAYCKEAAKHITETEYHRGISLETLKRYGVGYEPEWRHPNAKGNPPLTPRLIVPNDSGGYLARDTRENLTDEQRKYTKQRAGHVALFNVKALRQREQPVFVVEGELDALSIIDAGGEAVALCSTANVSKLIEAMKRQGEIKVPLVIALDNDEAGKKASTQTAEALKGIKFFFYRNWPLPPQYNDENEFLLADRDTFTEWVKAGIAAACEPYSEESEEAEDNEAFERESVAYYLPEFLEMVKRNRERPAISTGFTNLDGLLGGGLYAGLYFVGAISSLGKTTLVLQIADNIAQSKHGVLIFSLEMARSELIAKSLSRLSFLKSHEMFQTQKHAKTTRGILRGYFGKEEQAVLMASLSEYSEYGKYIHITEGIGNVGVATVRAKTEEYIKHTGKPPVVVIDYTQILQPQEKHMTDKQSVDGNVVELKRISRDYDTPVIAISSFNRDNYSAPLNMAAFKESGSIEYSSDVLIGLQYKGWDYQDGEKGEKDSLRLYRLRRIREANELMAANLGAQSIQLKVLKNRNGKRGSCYFSFWPAFNLFAESEEAE